MGRALFFALASLLGTVALSSAAPADAAGTVGKPDGRAPQVGFRTKPAGGGGGLRDLLQPMEYGGGVVGEGVKGPGAAPGASKGGEKEAEGGLASPRKNPEAQRFFDRAVAAFGRGDLEVAGRDFRKVLELSPVNPAATVNLGLVEYRRRKYDEARTVLTRLVRWQPENGLGWLLLGMVEYDSGRLDPAFAALAQAVLHAPKDARAHHFLGATIAAKGWYLGAESEMRRAVELDPEYAEAHYNLSVFYLQRVPPAVELARRHYVRAKELGAASDPEMEKKFSADGPLPVPGGNPGL